MIELLLRRGRVRISDLGEVTAKERMRLLQWIGRCMTAGGTYSFVTPEGVRIRMSNPRTEERAIMYAEDGELEMANYELYFMLTEAAGGAVAEAAAAGEERREL